MNLVLDNLDLGRPAKPAPSLHVMRNCPACNRNLPFTPVSFRPDPSQPDGYSVKCTLCDLREQQELLEICAIEANTAVDARVQRAVIRMADRSGSDDAGVPHLRTVYQRVLEMVGGPEGLAAIKGATYLAAKPGSQQRVRIIEGIERLAIKTTELGSADLDLEKMTESELLEARRQIEEKINRQLKPDAVGAVPPVVVEPEYFDPAEQPEEGSEDEEVDGAECDLSDLELDLA